MVFQTEKELEKAAIPFLEQYLHMYSWQVPLHNRVIDLAAIDENGQLIGIEFKLRDWKRALTQAVYNTNAFDFMFVCVPGGRYMKKLKEYAKKLGVGVMNYDEEIETIKIVLNATKITKQWEPNVKYIKETIYNG